MLYLSFSLSLLQYDQPCNLHSVHPCDKDTKGGCDQTCNKDGEKAKCSCTPVDFKLGEDGKTCDPGKLYLC